MSTTNTIKQRVSALRASDIPPPVLAVFRGIGQVFFKENALTGALFALGIALSSPLMALGGVVGSAIGTATARVLKFDESDLRAGIYGFNSTLVGIATTPARSGKERQNSIASEPTSALTKYVAADASGVRPAADNPAVSMSRLRASESRNS